MVLRQVYGVDMTSSVNSRTRPYSTPRPTRSAVLGKLFDEEEAFRAADGWIRAVATFLVDAIAQLDVATVQVAADGLRDTAIRASDDRAESLLLGMLEIAHVAVRQLQSETAVHLVEPRSLAARFVRAVERHPGASNDLLTRLLDVEETQISRAGRRLSDLGLTIKRRVGRQNAWMLTPAGHAVAEHLAAQESEGTMAVGPQSRTAQRIYNAPPRNKRFVAPKEILESLEAVPDQGLIRQVITGFPGVGKSQVAAEFVHRNAHHYRVVWWVRGSSLLADFAVLADQLVPGQARPDLRAVAEDARRWLEATTESWLLVLDGTDDRDEVNRLVPSTGNGRVLVTSRSRIWGEDWTEYSLSSLSEENSRDMIVRGLPSDRWTDADVAQLVRIVERQPLALQQAADYILEREMTVRSYLDLLSQEPGLAGVAVDRNLNGDAVGVTSYLCYQAVSEDSPVAAQLMSALVFLGPDEIMTEDLEHITDTLTDQSTIEVALDRLSVYELADVKHHAVKVHPLVQQGLFRRIDLLTRQAAVASAVLLMQRRLPASTDEPEFWPLCERLFPHAIAATSHVDSTADRATLAAAGDIFARLADYAQARARFLDAKDLSERSMQMAEIVFDPESIEVAHRLRRHGEILRDLGNIVGAETHLTRAVRLANKYFVTKEQFDSESSLASLLRDKGDFGQALKLQEQALEVFGDDRQGMLSELDRAIACANLARVQHELGRVDDARQNFEAALFLKREWAMHQPGGHATSWGEDPKSYSKIPAGPVIGRIETARTLVDFAALLSDDNQPDAAERHLLEALAVLTTHGGEADPFVARAYVCLGRLYRQKGHIDEGLVCVQKGVAQIQACYGPEHHEVGRALFHLGFLLWDRDDFDAARKAFEDSYALISRSFGRHHPDAARALSGSAVVLQDSGDLVRAHEYNQDVLDIYQKAFGTTHLEVAGALDRLGFTVRLLGDPKTARLYHEKSLDTIDRVLSERRDPQLRVRFLPLINLARDLRELDEPLDARDKAMEALGLVSSSDRDVGIARLVLGQIERDLGCYSAANTHFQFALKSFQDHFGLSHRDVATAWRNIGVTDVALDSLPAAKSNLERAIAILKEHKTINPRELQEATEDLALVEHKLGHQTAVPTAMRDRVGGRLVLAGV